MKNKIVAILALLVMAITLNAAAAVDYPSLQVQARENMATALKSGKAESITAAATAIEALATARALDNQSAAQEAVAPIITGFAPQFSAIPMALKVMAVAAMEDEGKEVFTETAQAMWKAFINASTADEAKESLKELPAVIAEAVALRKAMEVKAQAAIKADGSIVAAELALGVSK